MMSKFFRSALAVLLCFCMICSLCGVGFAAGSNDAYSVGGDTSPPSVLPGGSGGALAPILTPSGDITYVQLPEDYVIKSAGLDGLYSIDPQSVLAPVTPANTTGLKSVLLSVLGNYEPIVAEYQYVNSGGSYNNYIREIQPDYVWLTSAAIFAILLYCTWRIFGGFICRK